jgi:hypothetical protein
MHEMYKPDVVLAGVIAVEIIAGAILIPKMNQADREAERARLEALDGKTLVTENADYKINQISGSRKQVQSGDIFEVWAKANTYESRMPQQKSAEDYIEEGVLKRLPKSEVKPIYKSIKDGDGNVTVDYQVVSRTS